MLYLTIFGRVETSVSLAAIRSVAGAEGFDSDKQKIFVEVGVLKGSLQSSHLE